MEKPDLSQNISFKSLGVLFGYMFKVWVRRMVMFGVIAGTWGLLNATEIGFLKTIAPFAAFGLALVVWIVFFGRLKPKNTPEIKS